MYTGFTKRFRPKNTSLTYRERDGAMWRTPDNEIRPDEHLSCVVFNSTYIEFVDRWFKIRGSIADIAGLICLIVAIFLLYMVLFHAIPDGEYLFAALIGVMGIGAGSFFTNILFRKEFFTYTHWPIRFNRTNRMVYFFRHNGPGGVVRVPFDDVFFHLGHSNSSSIIKDLRAEVVEDGIVTHTFAVGNYIGDKWAIAELWEFILRYMERGPESVKPDHLSVSIKKNWHNAFVQSGGRVGATMAWVFLPFVLLTSATRWLVMKSCRTPVWPDDVEAECAVSPDDPYDLPQPIKEGEFDK